MIFGQDRNFHKVAKTFYSETQQNMWQYWTTNVRIVTPSYFIQTPGRSSSSRSPTARWRDLWSKCCRGIDFRRSPRTSEIGGTSRPAKIPWEKPFLVIMFVPPRRTRHTHMSHSPGTHGQCCRPYHRCGQCHRVSFVSLCTSQVRARLAWGVVRLSGL